MKIFSLLLLSPFLFAEEPDADAYLRLSYFTGSSAYEIQGVSGNEKWRSRLVFPINNWRLDSGVSVKLREVELSFGGWSTLDKSSGTLKDDDWVEDVRDIWSRSDLDLSAWGLNGNLNYWSEMGKDFSIGPKLELSFDHFSYDAYDVRQWGAVVSRDGKVLTYDQYKFAIVPGIASKWRPAKNLDISMDISATPLCVTWDEDDHLLRSKLSEAIAMAWLFSVGLNVDYTVKKFDLSEFKIGINTRYNYFESWVGEQSQKFYGGSNQGISYKNIEYATSRESFQIGLNFIIHF